MIPRLVSIFGAERTSYMVFGFSQILFPLSFIYVNDNKFNPVETNMIRGFASIILNFFIIRYYSMDLDYKYDINFLNLLKRNGIMVVHGLAMAAAQLYLPMPIVMTLSCSAPIYIFIIDYFENGVRISKLQFYSLLLGIFGILCTVNGELVAKLLDKNYQINSLFTYGSKSPSEFAIYALLFCCIMFLWAFGLLRVRTFHKMNHTQVNFHFGLLLIISSGFLYPFRVINPTQLYKIGIGLFATGLPLALAQLFFVAGLGLNKKTGTLIILQCITIIISYAISYLRYGEVPEAMEWIGSTFIILSVIGVIKLGDEDSSSQSTLNSTLMNPIQTEKTIKAEDQSQQLTTKFIKQIS